MKRRSFLRFAGIAAATGAAPIAGIGAEPSVVGAPLVSHPFIKMGALRPPIDCDLTECSLEDAVVKLIMDERLQRLPLVFTLVIPVQQMFVAAHLCVELIDVRAHLPKSIPQDAFPRIDYRIDYSMTDYYEWGMVALNGRCFYSQGA